MSATTQCSPPTPKPVVIDNSSEMIIAGFAGDKEPTVTIPTKQPNMQISPLREDEVIDWKDMETVWQLVFKDHLKISPSDQPVLFTDAVTDSNANRAKTIEIVMDKLGAKSFFLARRSVLSVYAYGLINGLSVLTDNDATFIAPMLDGYKVPDRSTKLNIGTKAGPDALIEKLCPEVYNVATKCNPEKLQDLLGNIVLSGSIPKNVDFDTKLQAGIQALAGETRVKVTATNWMEYAPWIGGSILASHGEMAAMWVTKDMYDKEGSQVINQGNY